MGLVETLDELTRNKGILYDAAVVDTCLNLYGQDLPAPREVTIPLPPVSPGDGPQAYKICAQMPPWPQAKGGKPRNWAKLHT